MPGEALGIGASVVGGVINKKSSDNAAKAQTEAADRAAEVQKEMFDTTRADLAPYRASGSAANTKLSQLMGLDITDRTARKEQLLSKYPNLAKLLQPKPAAAAPAQQNQFLQDSPYILPQDYMSKFVPQSQFSQFLKPPVK